MVDRVEAVERVLGHLSTLLQRNLHNPEFSLSPAEQQIVQILREMRTVAEEDGARIDVLTERVEALERQNMELMVRNRVLSEVTARDTLTGLYQRWYVLEKIESEINRSLRHGSPMALMMLDLDHFKDVNDRFGHSVGDQVLQSVGKLLKDSCRVYDVPGRYGGEEFCVLLPQIALEQTPVVAERIRQRLETTEIPVGESALVVTASIGVAGLEADGSFLSPSVLIDRADRALYAAKHRGRNRVEIWSGPQDISH
jgi:diguanylate cyclase (GGDEF)-like protein